MKYFLLILLSTTASALEISELGDSEREFVRMAIHRRALACGQGTSTRSSKSLIVVYLGTSDFAVARQLLTCIERTLGTSCALVEKTLVKTGAWAAPRMSAKLHLRFRSVPTALAGAVLKGKGISNNNQRPWWRACLP